MRIATFLVLVFSVAISAAAQADDGLKREREIAFQSGNFSEPYRRAVLRGAFVKAIHETYKADKKQFYVFDTRAYDERAIPGDNKRQLTEKQVVDQADEKARKMLDGSDLRSAPYYEVIKSLVGLLPYKGAVAMDIIAGMTAGSGGKIKQYDPGWYRENGRALLAAVDEGGPLGERVHLILQAEMGFNAKYFDSSNVLAVREAKERAEKVEARGTIKEFGEWLAIEKEKQDLARSRAVEVAIKKKRLAEYERQQSNLVGSMEALGYGLQILGAPEDADRVFTVAKITTTIMDLNRPEPDAKLTTGALLSGYMGAAAMAISLFNKGEDGNQAMMKAILEAIYDLREEMHNRFDAVDSKLAEILVVQNRNFNDIKRTIRELRRNNDQIADLIDDRTKRILDAIEEQGKKQELTFSAKCTNYRGAIRPNLTEGERDACINFFDMYANEFSMMSTVALTPPGRASEDDDAFPYGSGVQYVARMGIIFGAEDLPGILEPPDSVLKKTKVDVTTGLFIPNPVIWLEQSSDFLGFLDEDDERRTAITESGYDNFIHAGESIQRFYKHLTLDKDGAVRSIVFKNILKDYREAGERVYGIARRYAVVTPNPDSPMEPVQELMDLAKYEKQLPGIVPLYFSPNVYGSQKLGWCGAKQYSRAPYFDKAFVVGRNYDPVSQGLTLDEGTHQFVDNDVKLYEWLGLGRIQFCLRQFTFVGHGRTTPNGRTSDIDYNATVGVRFVPSGKNAKPIEVANLTVGGNVAIRFAINGTQHRMDMVWNWPNHLGDRSKSKSMPDNGGLTAKEALTRVSRVNRESLIDTDAFAETREKARQKLRALRDQQIVLMSDESAEYEKEWKNMDELRELIFALYEIGLRPNISNDERLKFVEALSPVGGVLDDTALVNYAVYGQASPADRRDPEYGSIDLSGLRIRASSDSLKDLGEYYKANPWKTAARSMEQIFGGGPDRDKTPPILSAPASGPEPTMVRNLPVIDRTFVIDEIVVVDPGLVELRDSIARLEVEIDLIAETARVPTGHPLIDAQNKLLEDSKTSAYPAH